MASLMVFDFETGRDIFFRRARRERAREEAFSFSFSFVYIYVCIYTLFFRFRMRFNAPIINTLVLLSFADHALGVLSISRQQMGKLW